MPARPRTIVVGYDGSEAAERALDVAADLSGYGSMLTVVTVHDGRLSDDVGRAARERLLGRHAAARYVEPVGDPAEKLLETASDVGADLVVVGERPRNGLRRFGLSSVSASVVGRADCDVLVVR